MAGVQDTKLKILYLANIFMEKTDENHYISISQMIKFLEGYNIKAERKSLYDDIEKLRFFGMDINSIKGNNGGYALVNRDFELAELKILVDAVQCSKFITHKKSNELIKKLEGLLSEHQGKELQRQVYVSNRVKTMNESIYYLIDELYDAINQNKQISFLYNEWTLDFKRKEKVAKKHKKNGERYLVSPWALLWDDENYYMVAYDSASQEIRHYRVDKMEKIKIEESKREGQEESKRFDAASYNKKVFSMFSGEEQNVKLKFTNNLIGVVADRFGKTIFPEQIDDEHFAVTVKVEVSKSFFAWLCGFGSEVTIISPPKVASEYREHLNKILSEY